MKLIWKSIKIRYLVIYSVSNIAHKIVFQTLSWMKSPHSFLFLLFSAMFCTYDKDTQKNVPRRKETNGRTSERKKLYGGAKETEKSHDLWESGDKKKKNEKKRLAIVFYILAVKKVDGQITDDASVDRKLRRLPLRDYDSSQSGVRNKELFGSPCRKCRYTKNFFFSSPGVQFRWKILGC